MSRSANPPLRRLTRSLFILASVVLTTGSCHNFVAPLAARPYVSPFPPNSLHGFAPPFLAKCAAMEWTPRCDDPLYTDDQSFRVDANDYGPHAYAAPAPGLEMATDESAFSSPRLVALVYVKPPANGVLPLPYQSLRLEAGSNCVYLHYAGSTYTAYVVPSPTANPCAGSIAPDQSHALQVTTIQNPSPWNAPPNASIAANIPAVARFHEAHVPKSVTPYTLIGLRCGNKWCVLWPTTTTDQDNPAHQGKHGERRGWSVRGWGDAQHLAQMSAAGAVTRSDIQASILPVDDLASKTFAAPEPGEHPGDAQHVATIYFKNDPTGVYGDGASGDGWHFRKHENELYIWKDASSPTGWSGEIQNKSFLGMITHHIPVNVEPRHVGTNPPATARFRWSADDEDVWVKCDGCCYVSRKM